MFKRQPQQGMGSVQVELSGDVRAVILHRAVTDGKQFADFLAGHVFGDQLEYPQFRRCQGIQRAGDPRFVAFIQECPGK